LLSPFAAWCARNGIEEEAVAKRLQICKRYVRQLGNGNRVLTNYQIAKGMSAITGGEISAAALLEWRRSNRRRCK
jgi:DNA-binding transcriptional regulator YdaS (Cro superfamily)